MRLLKLKKLWGIAGLLLLAGSTVFAVSDSAPPGGVPIQSSLAVANATSGDGKYHDSVTAKVDEVVKFEIWYHNPEPSGSNSIATNVNIKINVPTGMRKTHTATSTVSGTNTNTETDIATVNTAINTSLEYIPGTAYRRYNKGTATNKNIVTEKISDSVVGTGYVIPQLKPCWEFQETITAQYRVKAPVFTVNKYVRKSGTTQWLTSITAQPGDKLEYQLAIKNVSNVTLNNMLIRDSFPPKLDYIEGSALLKNGRNPSGIKASDNLINGGTFIGDYAPGAAAYIKFDVNVPKELSGGCYTFKNVVNAKAEETEWFNNEALVKTCYESKVIPPEKEKPPVIKPVSQITQKESLPVTGPQEAALGFGTLTMSGAVLSYLKSKRGLRNSLLGR